MTMGFAAAVDICIALVLELMLLSTLISNCRGNNFGDFAVDANDYHSVYGYLSLGECPSRKVMTKGKEETLECPYDFKGNSRLIYRPITSISYKEIRSTSEALDLLDITVGAGVSFFRLVGASVSVRVATTVQKKSNTLVLCGNVEVTRGVLTMTGKVKPVRTVDPNFPTKVYVSDILIGAKETLLVELEFQTESRRRVIEVTISIKLLFVTISKKMRFIKENFQGAAKVKIQHISTLGNVKATFDYVGLEAYDEALLKVEELEKRLKNLPNIINSKSNRHLHLKYYFKTWDNKSFYSTSELKRINFELKRLTYQEAEIDSVLIMLSKYIEMGLPADVLKTLEDYQMELSEKKRKLSIARKDYLLVSKKKRESFFEIFGRFTVAGYYRRKLYNMVPY